MAEVRETDTKAAAKTPQTASNSDDGKLFNFSDNPIRAIGLILSNVSAGMQGRPLPTQLLREQQKERRLMEMKQLGLTLNAVQKGVELFGGADPNNPQVQEFVGKFSQSLPGFGEAFSTAMEIANTQGIQALEGAGEHTEKIYAMCGLDRDCIKGVISDSNLMKRFDQTADAQRMPTILQKFQAITEAVGGEPELQKLIADGEWTLGDLQQLPEGFEFTQDELRTIRRSQDLQNALIEYNFVPPSVSAEAAKAKATSGLELSVQALMEVGVPREIAVKTRTGAFKAITDENDRISIIDQTTGQTIWPAPGGEAEPTGGTEVEAPGGLAEATGGSGVLKNFGNIITDFFGAGLQFEDAAAAIDHLQNLKTFTTLGLSRDLATRDTNMVRSLIQDLLPDPKKLSVGDARSLSKLEAVRDQLKFILDGEQEVLDNKRDYPRDQVQKAKGSTKNLRRMIEMYDGIIDNWYEKPGNGEKTSFSNMSDEELANVEITDENVEEFNEEMRRRGVLNGER